MRSEDVHNWQGTTSLEARMCIIGEAHLHKERGCA